MNLVSYWSWRKWLPLAGTPAGNGAAVSFARRRSHVQVQGRLLGAGISRYSVTPKLTAPIPWALGDPRTFEFSWHYDSETHRIKLCGFILLNLSSEAIEKSVSTWPLKALGFLFYLKPPITGVDVNLPFSLLLQGPWTPHILSARPWQW